MFFICQLKKKQTFLTIKKTIEDQNVLWGALISDKIDVIATDHAPHTIDEKNRPYTDCPSGGPLVQHSLYVMYEHFLNNKISLEKIVQKMWHNPAILFNIKKRGFVREGFFADFELLGFFLFDSQ